jgi:hypothetical protein
MSLSGSTQDCWAPRAPPSRPVDHAGHVDSGHRFCGVTDLTGSKLTGEYRGLSSSFKALRPAEVCGRRPSRCPSDADLASLGPAIWRQAHFWLPYRSSRRETSRKAAYSGGILRGLIKSSAQIPGQRIFGSEAATPRELNPLRFLEKMAHSDRFERPTLIYWPFDAFNWRDALSGCQSAISPRRALISPDFQT